MIIDNLFKSIDKKLIIDLYIKLLVDNFKDSLDNIDDELFVEVVEDMDVKEFNSLLEQESWSTEEAEKVIEYIEDFKDRLRNNIENKILKLVDTYNSI
ncbi:MAG: hypothetical protein ACI3VR_04465 [Intestinibacter sp.]|uniref:hypothetical protein n=1 Tax=Intestinibacter sp. TaxID=1965304 RepID=UPI003F156908